MATILFDATTYRNASSQFAADLVPARQVRQTRQYDTYGRQLPVGPSLADELWLAEQRAIEEERPELMAFDAWVREQEASHRLTDADIYPSGAWS